MRGRRKKRNKIDNQIRASYFKDFNEGLPEGADYRQIKKAVAGMSQDFSTPVVAEYYEGTNFAPSTFEHEPTSDVALECGIRACILVLVVGL